jgi:hypothetical protein
MSKCERCGQPPHPGPTYAVVWPYARCEGYVPRTPWYMRAWNTILRGVIRVLSA